MARANAGRGVTQAFLPVCPTSHRQGCLCHAIRVDRARFDIAKPDPTRRLHALISRTLLHKHPETAVVKIELEEAELRERLIAITATRGFMFPITPFVADCIERDIERVYCRAPQRFGILAIAHRLLLLLEPQKRCSRRTRFGFCRDEVV